VRYLVTVADDAPRDGGISLYLTADDEERAAESPRGQDVENRLGILARPVVECQRDAVRVGAAAPVGGPEPLRPHAARGVLRGSARGAGGGACTDQPLGGGHHALRSWANTSTRSRAAVSASIQFAMRVAASAFRRRAAASRHVSRASASAS